MKKVLWAIDIARSQQLPLIDHLFFKKYIYLGLNLKNQNVYFYILFQYKKVITAQLMICIF
jgi:hypothetical protein